MELTVNAPAGNKAAAWIAPPVLALFGVILLLVSVSMIRKSAAAAGWPTVDGRVSRSTVVSEQSRDDKGRTTVMYAADIVFDYTVKDRSFSSTTLSPGGRSSSSMSSMAESTVGKYPSGSKVTVHYNPDAPSEAFLETSAGILPWILLPVSLVLFALAVGVVFAILKARKA